MRVNEWEMISFCIDELTKNIQIDEENLFSNVLLTAHSSVKSSLNSLRMSYKSFPALIFFIGNKSRYSVVIFTPSK